MNNKVEFLVPNIILVNNTDRLTYRMLDDINKQDSQLMFIYTDTFDNVTVTDQQDYIESICDQMRVNFKRLGIVVSTTYSALYNKGLHPAMLLIQDRERLQYQWQITITTLKEF